MVVTKHNKISKAMSVIFILSLINFLTMIFIVSVYRLGSMTLVSVLIWMLIAFSMMVLSLSVLRKTPNKIGKFIIILLLIVMIIAAIIIFIIVMHATIPSFSILHHLMYYTICIVSTILGLTRLSTIIKESSEIVTKSSK